MVAGALSGPDALSIDTKVDDGFANAGKVRGLNPGAIWFTQLNAMHYKCIYKLMYVISFLVTILKKYVT
jgi:hypothetical protein